MGAQSEFNISDKIQPTNLIMDKYFDCFQFYVNYIAKYAHEVYSKNVIFIFFFIGQKSQKTITILQRMRGIQST